MGSSTITAMAGPGFRRRRNGGNRTAPASPTPAADRHGHAAGSTGGAGVRRTGQFDYTSDTTGSRPGHHGETPDLPDGYRPVREVTEMELMGRWTPLDDAMSPCMPSRIVAAMQRRMSLGDHDAEAWLDLLARANAGDPAAQRALGTVFENGRYRTAADLQRAFFWYYRAGLQGDPQARRDAERLTQTVHISAAAMAEPVLVYPGRWRITVRLAPRFSSTSVFDLAEDGSAAGTLVHYGDPESAHAGPPPAPYSGGWAYDGYGNVLTVVFESDGASARHWRIDNWQISITGCRPGSLFGRDRHMAAYTLEYLAT